MVPLGLSEASCLFILGFFFLKTRKLWIILGLKVGIRLCLASQPTVQAPLDDEMVPFRFVRDFFSGKCTAILVGPQATVDGSIINTHNNDCVECDIRITNVPSYDWIPGSMRPVYPIKTTFPRYLEARSDGQTFEDIDASMNTPEHSWGDPKNIHGPEYLLSRTLQSLHNNAWTLSEANLSQPFFYLPQVVHTFAYTLGTYPIQNEMKVALGESTCAARFYSKPTYAGGYAKMSIMTLAELALERCASARCAVTLMGQLGERWGFFGEGWDVSEDEAYDEAGEALTVSDTQEAWVFHILPDDTGRSAVWAAQRLAEDHVTVVANQFIIGELSPQLIQDNPAHFQASRNLFAVAARNGLWSPEGSEPLHFARVFSKPESPISNREGYLSTRRIWRIFTLVSPSLLPRLSAYTDAKGSFGFRSKSGQEEGYPFSVIPDWQLSIQDVMELCRDQFEGSEFDLSEGLDAGPFGDVMRYPPTPKDPDKLPGERDLTPEQIRAGLGYQRPVSLWRTVYSVISHATTHGPLLTHPALVWIAPYGPHHSSYVPVFVSTHFTPTGLSLDHYHAESNYWVHCICGNYASRLYRHTIKEVKTLQEDMQATIEASLGHIAIELHLYSYQYGSLLEEWTLKRHVIMRLGQWQQQVADQVRSRWWQFFFHLTSKFRDGFTLVQPTETDFRKAIHVITVRRGWLESVGYWGRPFSPPPGCTESLPIRPINVPSLDSQGAYYKAYPLGMQTQYAPFPRLEATDFLTNHTSSRQNSSLTQRGQDIQSISRRNWSIGLWDIILIAIGFIIGYVVVILTLNCSRQRFPYLPI